MFYANRLWMLLVEQALCEIDSEEALVAAPSGHLYKGNFLPEHTRLCGISVQTNVVEANTTALNSLLLSLQALLNNEGCNLSHFGEIVVDKRGSDGASAAISGGAGGGHSGSSALADTRLGTAAHVSKSVLPGDISSRYALLVHPTLSTGTSIKVAVEHLVREKRVDQRQIIVLVLLSCPSSVEAMNAAFPGVRIVTAGLDEGLDPATGRIYPGFGSFGHRYSAGISRPQSDRNDDAPSMSILHGWSGPSVAARKHSKMKRRKTRRTLANKRKL